MRKYELMTVFPLDEEKSKKGADDVRSVLNEFGAEIEKQKRGRFILFTMKLNPAKIIEINKQFRLNVNMLKYLFVKLDEKDAN